MIGPMLTDAGKTHSISLRQERTGDSVIQIAIRLGLLAFLIYWSYILLRPFIPILAWAVVLAVALSPSYEWLSAHLGDRPRTAAFVITIVILTVFLGPAAWIGLGLVEGLRSVSEHLSSGEVKIPTPPASVEDWPLVGKRLYDFWSQASLNLEATFRQIAPYLKPLTGPILAFAGSVGAGTLKFLASVAIAGFLLPSGPRFVATTRTMLARIVPERRMDFLALAGATIRTV